MRIAHFADTHIKNLWYHEEYLQVYREIDTYLKHNPVDLIIHVGDIVHNKNVLSPESVVMVARLLKIFTKHAPTYVVPGNHDGIVCNLERVDSVTAVSELIGKSPHGRDGYGLFILKDTAQVKFKDDIVLCPISIFSEDDEVGKFPEREQGDGTWIGLYHGVVGSVCTDTNYTLNGSVPLERFNKFDFLMLGHIHKAQKLDPAGRWRYPGSTIQQGYEESVDKGFLIWDIKSRDEFSVDFVKLQNPRPFQSLVVDSVAEFKKNHKSKGILPGARLKLTNCDISASPMDVAELVKFIKSKYDLTTIQLAKGAGVNVAKINDSVRTMSLGHLEVQNALIREYLNDTLCIRDPDLIESVVSMNSEFFSQEEPDAYEVARDCEWKLRRIDWSNFFNYSSDNTINFENIRPGSVVGIFGKNASGKSSLIDILCYGIWGKVTKENNKNGDLIRVSEKAASVTVQYDQFAKRSEIFRALEKTKNGATTSELLFNSGEDAEDKKFNNAEDRKNNTTKLIASQMGSFQDFCSTSFMAQDGGLMFINEGSAGRRDLLKRLLNLNVFDKRIRKVNGDLDFYKRKKKLDNKELVEKEVSAISEKIEDLEARYLQKRDEYRAVAEKEKEIVAWVAEFDKKNYELLELNKRQFRSKMEDRLAEVVSKYLATKREISEGENSLREPTKASNCSLNAEYGTKISKIRGEIADLQLAISTAEYKIKKINAELPGLRSVPEIETPPCVSSGTVFEQRCALLDDYEATKQRKRDKISGLEAELKESVEVVEEKTRRKSELERELNILQKKFDYLQKFTKSLNSYRDFMNKLDGLRRLSEGLSRDYVALKREIAEQRMIESKKVVFQSLLAEKDAKDAQLKQVLLDKRACEADGKQIRDQMMGEKARLEVILAKEKELAEDVAREYRLELLQKAIGGTGGVTVSLFKRYVPLINEEANSVIHEIFDDMQVRLEATEKDTLEVYFSRGERQECGVGMASGSEKAAISLALRLALATVSTLPKSNIFIMDEPFSSFDFSRIDDFERILSVLRTKFEYILLITHAEKVKDFADEIIYLNPDENGVSSVNV